jgi:hypothetical protein
MRFFLYDQQAMCNSIAKHFWEKYKPQQED